MLALLADRPEGVSRDRLAGLLWAESSDQRARHALAQVLYRLRRELGETALTGGATVCLDPATITSDLDQFTRALERHDHARVAELYQGPFMDGFHLNDCVEFEHWVEARRTRTLQDARFALETLAQQAEREGESRVAVRWWARLAALDPWDSGVALAHLEAMAAAGDRAGALRQAHVHVTRLREELGVDADARVLSFIERMRATTAAAAPAAIVDTRAAPDPAPPPPAVQPSPPRRVPNRLWPALAAVLTLALVIGAVVLSSASDSASHLLLVTEAENATGDPIFDLTVPYALSAGLALSPRVRILGEERVRQALLLMRRDAATAPVDASLGRDVAVREGARWLIVPTVARRGEEFEIGARIVDAVNGEVLAVEAVATRGHETVVDALDQLSRRLRRRLGEPAFAMRRNAVPLPRVTTASLEALQRYVEGSIAFNRGQLAGARSAWTEAAAIDSAFATAHAALGMLGYWTNHPSEGEVHFARAVALLGRLPEREAVLIRARIEGWRGNRQGAIDLLDALVQRDPDDLRAWNALGYEYLRLDRDAEAIVAFQHVIAVDSTDHTAFINIAAAATGSGRYSDALRYYERAFSLAPGAEVANNNLNLEYGRALVHADLPDSAEVLFSRMLGDGPAKRARGLRSLAFLAAYRGRYEHAAQLLREAVVLSRTEGARLSEIRNRLLLATTETQLGRTREADAQLDSAFALTLEAEVESTMLLWLGRALARAGKVTRAATLRDRVATMAREESAVDGAALHGLRAEVLLARGRVQEALPEFERALALDSTRLSLDALAWAAVNAEQLQRADSLYMRVAAGRDFGWEGQEVWRMADYRRGRVAELRADTAAARTHYAGFLAAWSEADPALPVVRDAAGRWERLTSSSPR